jgi:hypothetical protein
MHTVSTPQIFVTDVLRELSIYLCRRKASLEGVAGCFMRVSGGSSPPVLDQPMACGEGGLALWGVYQFEVVAFLYMCAGSASTLVLLWMGLDGASCL